jgi:pyruvate/2-oxoglutarate dehydrogenase complex dihydrolipoamide acyltransferase (E2) component
MAELLRMPEVAANTTEAILLTWPIPENTPYSAADTIVTVETAKAVVDVEAEADGMILRTLVQEGAEVAVGEAIALIGMPVGIGTGWGFRREVCPRARYSGGRPATFRARTRTRTRIRTRVRVRVRVRGSRWQDLRESTGSSARERRGFAVRTDHRNGPER